jgi:glycosyltransferase involved in cell wall biosynthesis
MARIVTTLNATLYVVGEFYDDRDKYVRQIGELGIGQHVVVNSEYVPNGMVGLYFSAADVVMLPYISATQSGIAQIAYNFNKPVIATNVGGLAEVVRDGVTGFVVPPNDPQALARAVTRYFVEQREQEFAANVMQEKKKYSWETMVNAIEEFMR